MERGVRLPAGTVTFLFSDIEGSTRLLQQLGDGYARLLAKYREVLRSAAAAHGGHEVDTSGDACFFAFPRVVDAVAAAIHAQRGLAGETWPPGAILRCRMGIHIGEPSTHEGNYVGIDVHRAARICDAAHGGQILTSDAVRVVLEQTVPPGVSLKLLGEFRLKDLLRPERLFQVEHPDLPMSFPPLRTLDAHPNNLPLQPTPFIGRSKELAQTRAALLDEGVRLLTLTGPGGTGKTRLALQLAAQVIDVFHHGAFFVPLAHVTDPAMIVPSIAQVLGVNETPGRLLLDNLQEYLKDKQLVLVLDNLEQILQSAVLIDGLLAGCPGLRFVATSRERLHLSWEREFPVPALELPPKWKGDLDAVAGSTAVVLFVNRCRAVQPNFTLTPENAEGVVTICTRLEGLPLAIELAAARIKILTPTEIVERLDEQFRLLRGGPRDAPQRHQSLQAAMSWSYQLLSPEEQRLFRRLAVFRGGFALEAAEAIADDVDVLDRLSSLIDKSLLQRTVGTTGVARFLMIETIREYGTERLVAERELEAIRTRHARHFAEVAAELESRLLETLEEPLLARGVRDLANLRAALEWAVQSEDTPAAVRLGVGFGWLMYTRGYHTEGRARLAPVLSTPLDTDEHMGARLMFPAGVLAWSQGDAGQARRWLERARSVFQSHNDAKREAGVISFLGHLARSEGHIDQAAELHQNALVMFRAIKNEEGMAWALHDLGLAARDRGADDEAATLQEQSLAVFRKLGYRWGSAWALWNLGILAHRRGDSAGAAERFRHSLDLYRDVDDRRGIALCLEGLAGVAFTVGRTRDATRVLAAAEALRAGLGTSLAHASRSDYDRTVAGLKAALPRGEFEQEWRAGSQLDGDEVIQLALDAAQTPAPAQAAPSAGSVDPLSAREREVAALVARGLSNREIAAKLHIAERTAITHIEHIMNKLGLHSRAQIAAWAVRRGLDIPANS